MGSLQDALLKAGLAEETQLKKQRRPDKPGGGSPNRSKAGAKPNGRKKPAQAKADGKKAPRKTSAESDLARAYRARQQAEAAERAAERQRRQAAQDERRKRNLALDELIKGNTLNRKDAEMPRYFEHLGRIRRVLCTPEQRDQLNRGEIGVVNLRGSYLLVSLETLEKYREIAADLVPDLAGKDEPEDDGSHYPPVPDDLVW
jgi:uncharacterized protein